MRKEAPVSQGEETQPHALMGISKCSDCVVGLLDRDWYGTFCEWFILLFYLKHPLFLNHLIKSQITSLTNFILGKFNIPKMSLHSHLQLQNWTHPVFRTLVKGRSSRSNLRLPNISKLIPHVLKRRPFSSRRLSQALSLLSLVHSFSSFKICEFLGWLFSSELKLVNQMPQNLSHRICLIFLFHLAIASLHKLYCKANEVEKRRKTEKKNDQEETADKLANMNFDWQELSLWKESVRGQKKDKTALKGQGGNCKKLGVNK